MPRGRVTISSVFYALGLMIMCLTILAMFLVVGYFAFLMVAEAFDYHPTITLVVTRPVLWVLVKAVFLAGVAGYGAMFFCSALTYYEEDEDGND